MLSVVSLICYHRYSEHVGKRCWKQIKMSIRILVVDLLLPPSIFHVMHTEVTKELNGVKRRKSGQKEYSRRVNSRRVFSEMRAGKSFGAL